jgi:hypothetical protein
MEGQIEKAELKVAELQQKLEEPEIAADLEKVQKYYDMQQTAQEHVDQLYHLWQELEAKADLDN